MTYSGHGENLIAHLRDARFHLKQAERSIGEARERAELRNSKHELSELDRFTMLARSLLQRIGRRELRRRWRP